MPTGDPKPGEIYLLRYPLFRSSKHPHPVLIIRVNGPMATVNFMSSELALRSESKDFTIDERDPHFSSTGLKKSSYLVWEGALEVPVVNLREYWGFVPAGELRKSIGDWWGENF